MDIARLQLLHGSDVGGLDVVLVLLNAGLELVGRDLVVLDDQVDLELLDTETNGNELGGTPDEAILLNGADVGLHLLKVGLVVCKISVSIRFKETMANRKSFLWTYPRASPPW